MPIVPIETPLAARNKDSRPTPWCLATRLKGACALSRIGSGIDPFPCANSGYFIITPNTTTRLLLNTIDCWHLPEQLPSFSCLDDVGPARPVPIRELGRLWKCSTGAGAWVELIEVATT